jgi:hypothetical protein
MIKSISAFLNTDEMASELSTSLMKMFHEKTLKIKRKVWNLSEKNILILIASKNKH